jgi:hypothetical protein
MVNETPRITENQQQNLVFALVQVELLFPRR